MAKLRTCPFCGKRLERRESTRQAGRTEMVQRGDCVPKHGDLIERKAICLTNFEIAMCDGDYKDGMKMLLEKIESAPTIIPASKEGQ